MIPALCLGILVCQGGRAARASPGCQKNGRDHAEGAPGLSLGPAPVRRLLLRDRRGAAVARHWPGLYSPGPPWRSRLRQVLPLQLAFYFMWNHDKGQLCRRALTTVHACYVSPQRTFPGSAWAGGRAGVCAEGAKWGLGCQNQKEAGLLHSPTESSPKLISALSRGQQGKNGFLLLRWGYTNTCVPPGLRASSP